MDRITHCGYDMDYTLAEYLEEFGMFAARLFCAPRLSAHVRHSHRHADF